MRLLDYKEIKPVDTKGNQPQIFIRKTDAEAEAPILWPPDELTHWKYHHGNSGQKLGNYPFFVVQSLSCVQLFATPWSAACQTSLSFTISWSFLKLMGIESVMPSNHLVLCCPLLLLHSIFPSIMISSNESALHIRWPKYWSFSFSISPSNEYSGLISFRIDWFDLLAVQGTLKSLLQQHSSKA